VQPLAVLFLTVFIDLMGFGIVIPLLPIYAERFQASPFAAGALIAVYSLMQLAFAPLWGVVSDRRGRRPVLLVSLVGSALSYFLLAGAWSLEVLFAARILAGMAGANIPVAQAYIADVTEPADRARGMGLIGAAFGLGMVVGPALGGGLSLLGPRVPELFAAGLCLVNVGLAARILPESLPRAERRQPAFRHPLSAASLRAALAPSGTSALLTIFFLVTLCFSVLEGTFSLVAAHLYAYSSAQVGWTWLYMGLIAVVVQGRLVGRLARVIPERLLVAAGACVLAVGLAGVPHAHWLGWRLGTLALVVTGQGLAGPSLSSLISKAAPRDESGRVLGVSQSLSAAARVLGPAGGGWAFERFGAGNAYVGAALCAVGALVLTLPSRTGEKLLAFLVRFR
jgi:DHA1 family tetracycline resistance protein-like MFS transporter